MIIKGECTMFCVYDIYDYNMFIIAYVCLWKFSVCGQSTNFIHVKIVIVGGGHESGWWGMKVGCGA